MDIAQKLADQLAIGFHGCGCAIHNRMHREHAATVTEHTSIQELNEILETVPDTLSSEGLLQHGQVTSAETREWKPAFTGIVPGQEDADRQIHVCLHSSAGDQTVQSPEVTFDIDSILGFPSSLAVARQGFRFNLTPHVVSNLSTDVHLKMVVRVEDRPRHVPLHEVPHFLLGHTVGVELPIFIFFPRLYRPEAPNNYLTQAVLKRWTDHVFLSAVYSQTAASTTQHYPASFQHAKLSSRAKNMESLKTLDKTGFRSQAIHHFLQPEHLEAVWDIILHTIEEPGMQDFGEAQLFFNGKNLKLWTRSATWRGTWEPFFQRWDAAIDADHLDETRVWIDLAKEVCPSSSFLPLADAGPQQAACLLWRPCCLEHYWHWSLHGAPARTSHRTYYQQSFLRDAADLTVVASPNSPSHRQGLLYSQFYHPLKNVFDAAKTFPFQDPFIESLALDPKLRASWQTVAGAHNHRPATLLQSYLHAKARCHAGLRDSMQKSFGLREEHRMTLPLAGQLRARLQAMEKWDVEIQVPPLARPYRSLPTAVYLTFIRNNINKLTTGFEYVHSLRVKDLVRWEHTKMMIMFLRLLKFSHGGHALGRHMAVWRDRVVRENGTRFEGLGLSRTLPEYGYGWYADKIDWDQCTFKAAVTDHMLFGNVHMAQAYRKRWREVKEVTDDFLTIEQIDRWLGMYQTCGRIRRWLLNWLVQICIGHFRKDVLGSIKSSIREECRGAAIRGEFMLCQHDLRRILQPDEHGRQEVWLVRGNKMAFKQLGAFVDFLWDYNDGWERKHWDSKGYRVLYQRCVRIVGGVVPREMVRHWKRHVKALFVVNHWILPYPNDTVFWQHTKAGERMWLSVYHPQLGGADAEPGRRRTDYNGLKSLRGLDGWIVGRKEHEVLKGRPGDCTDYQDVRITEVDEDLAGIWEEDLQERRRQARRPELQGAGVCAQKVGI